MSLLNLPVNANELEIIRYEISSNEQLVNSNQMSKEILSEIAHIPFLTAEERIKIRDCLTTYKNPGSASNINGWIVYLAHRAVEALGKLFGQPSKWDRAVEAISSSLQMTAGLDDQLSVTETRLEANFKLTELLERINDACLILSKNWEPIAFRD